MINFDDRDEILGLIRSEIEIDHMVTHPGTYSYLCAVNGVPMLTHRPVGDVLRHIA